MTVDVVIPCWNRPAFLSQAVDSVLTQQVSGMTLFIVDDYSVEPLEKPQGASSDVEIQMFRTSKNLGIGGARNFGASRGKNPYLAFLDSDDWWSDGALLHLLGIAQKERADLVFGGVKHVGDGVNFLDSFSADLSVVPMAGTSLMRRALFEQLDGFNPKLRSAEFIDFYSRAKTIGAMVKETSSLVLHRRVHDANISRLSSGTPVGYLKAVRDHLSRRSER